MFEKVNPSHPDKVADRIAGAMVDLAYKKKNNPRIAVEVLIGHNTCHIIAETSVHFAQEEIESIVSRIAGKMFVDYKEVAQDIHLSQNQEKGIRCGDNGIFRGVPATQEQKRLSDIAHILYRFFPTDGKYILNGDMLTICQSNAKKTDIHELFPYAIVNPLGTWTGGTDVDSGATNRKLGSDMADSITGGGLHGKDLSKADVSVNIYVWLKAQYSGRTEELCCSIGDDTIDGEPYSHIVDVAAKYIKSVGGFEKFAEWGLV